MLRKRKGRCHVHGDWCDPAVEVQQGEADRAREIEKREWKKEAEEELENKGD